MQKKKKGFTLVELLVVIAILAILAGVSVVGYLSFTKKANLSNDQTMIKMVNDNLQAASIEEKPKNASDAITTLYSLGFNSDKLQSFSNGYHYVYNLEENKFYLVNDSDKVVYPNEKDITSMWALYRDTSSDLINGVNKYVALESVFNQNVFDSAFINGGELDLNNFILNVNNTNNKQIKLSNGSISNTAQGFESNETVKKQTVFNKNSTLDDIEVVGNRALVENYYISVENSGDFIDKLQKKLPRDNKEIVISKSTFAGDNTHNSFWWDAGFSNAILTIENSIFTNFQKWSFVFGSSASNITYKIKNNLFINTGRGINVQGGSNLKPKSEISGNTFKLGKTDKANAIQFADFTPNKFNEISADQFFITIKENKMVSGNAFVILHGGVINKKVSPNNLINIANFENNHIEQGIKNVVIDPDLSNDFPSLAGTEAPYLEKLESIVK